MTDVSIAQPHRRDFLFIVTGAAATVGAAAAVWPFVDQMEPDASTLAAGARTAFLSVAGLWLIGIAATFFLRKPADAAAPHAIH